LERLEAKRRVRLLETQINNWATDRHNKDNDEEKTQPSQSTPEQAPAKSTEPPKQPKARVMPVMDRPPKALCLSAVVEMSGEFSASGEGESAEFTTMENTLLTRLQGGTNGGGGTTNDKNRNKTSPSHAVDYFV
jgi:hypothetical protein